MATIITPPRSASPLAPDLPSREAVITTDDSDRVVCFVTRAELIHLLTVRVTALQAEGMTERAALRIVAAETGMHAMRIKRLVVLFPEA